MKRNADGTFTVDLKLFSILGTLFAVLVALVSSAMSAGAIKADVYQNSEDIIKINNDIKNIQLQVIEIGETLPRIEERVIALQDDVREIKDDVRRDNK